MSDFLLELSQNRIARQLINNLGLPLPMPLVLRRAEGPMTAQPLSGRTVALGSGANAALTTVLTKALTDMGATVTTAAAPGDGQKVDALVFDGTGRIVAQEPEPGEIVDRGASVRVRDRR